MKKMGRFKGTGRKLARLQIQESYWQQAIGRRSKAVSFAAAAGISMLTGWLFYRSVWSFLIVWPFGIWIYRSLNREYVNRKKSQFLVQFKQMTESVAQALRVGYSAENAWKEACREMKVLYPPHSLICREMDLIVRKLKLQLPLEQVLDDFSRRVVLEDVKNFTAVFTAAKRSGGDMIAIIQDTACQISEKIDVKREIDIILAAKKYEFRIMCAIPYVMILYLQFSFPEFMSVLYGNIVGIGVMTICLGIYAGACVLGLRLIRIEV